MLSGNKDNSVILQGLEEFKKNPNAIYDAIDKELTSLLDGNVVTQGQLNELAKLISLKLGFEKASAQYDELVNINLSKAAPQLEQLDNIAEKANIKLEEAKKLGNLEEIQKQQTIIDDVNVSKGDINRNASASAIVQIGIRINSENPQSVKLKDIKGDRSVTSTPPQVADTNNSNQANSNVETVIVTGKRNGDITVGQHVVNGLVTSQKTIESINPDVRAIAIAGIQAVATGGTKPLLEYGVSKGIEVAIPQLPESVVRPIANAVEKGTRVVGDGGSALLLDKTYQNVSNDNSTKARDGSSATAWAAGIIVGPSVDKALNKSVGKALEKFDALKKVDNVAKEAKTLEKIDIAPAKRNTGETVLGHYPEYVELSDKINARRFQIPDEVWNKMSEAERWEANKKFLDRTLDKNEIINLATTVNKARPNSYFEKEIEYLKSKGYKVSEDGKSLIPPKK